MLTVHLQRILEHVPSFTLVFDGIDRQREAPPTLLAALARLGEFIPALTTILILTVPRHRFLHSPGLPHIHFQPYSKSELLSIVAISPRPIFDPATSSPPSSPSEEAADAADSLYTWTRFTTAVYDSLARPAARDLVSFRALCDRLWPLFVAPIVAGDYGTRDFSKLVVAKRSLLRSEDALVCSIVPSTSSTPLPHSTRTTAATEAAAAKRHDLPYYSKLLLIAAYLASYNPARQDATYFMKSATDRKKKRQQRKSTAAGEAKNRKIARRLLGPQTFPLERLLAIFHAILPRDPPRSQTTNVDIQTQVREVASCLCARSQPTQYVADARSMMSLDSDALLSSPPDENEQRRGRIGGSHDEVEGECGMGICSESGQGRGCRGRGVGR